VVVVGGGDGVCVRDVMHAYTCTYYDARTHVPLRRPQAAEAAADHDADACAELALLPVYLIGL
jgi:hypothetical protein